jgi:HSP20 family protein
MLSTATNRLGTWLSDPFEAVRREVSRDFGLMLNGMSPGGVGRRYGHVSFWEDGGKVCLAIDVPGMQREDLDLTVEAGQLWIRGERKFIPHNGKHWYDERFYGQFERVVALPETIDPNTIEATLSDGVLHISLGKKPEHQPFRISVKPASDAESTPRISDN